MLNILSHPTISYSKLHFVLESTSENFEYETEVKIKILTSLKGIGTPLATAVMAITEPQKYCIVDSVLWAYIFNEEKSSFTINDYLKFHKIILNLSKKLIGRKKLTHKKIIRENLIAEDKIEDII